MSYTIVVYYTHDRVAFITEGRGAGMTERAT